MISPRRGSHRGAEPALPVILALALAASLGTALAKDTAFVEVVLFESSPNGDYTTYTTGLQGRFSKAGATISAEGEIVQVSVVSSSLCAASGQRVTGGGGRATPAGTRAVVSLLLFYLLPSCPLFKLSTPPPPPGYMGRGGLT